MCDLKAKLLDQINYQKHVFFRQSAFNMRIYCVECYSHCYCFSMTDREISKLFKLMGAPMTKIKWTGRTFFKGIFSGNVLEVKFSTTNNKMLHGGHIALHKFIRIVNQ